MVANPLKLFDDLTSALMDLDEPAIGADAATAPFDVVEDAESSIAAVDTSTALLPLESATESSDAPLPAPSSISMLPQPPLWPADHYPYVQSASGELQPEPINRDTLVTARQNSLENVVQHHGGLVHQLFSMDRFGSLVYYDPAQAAQEKSEPWKAVRYFLYSSVRRELMGLTVGQFAGEFDLYTNAIDPLVAAVTNLRARATRGAASSRKESLVSSVAGPSTLPSTSEKKATAATTKAKRRQSAPQATFEITPPEVTDAHVASVAKKGKGRAGGPRKSAPVASTSKIEEVVEEQEDSSMAVDPPASPPKGRGGRAKKPVAPPPVPGSDEAMIPSQPIRWGPKRGVKEEASSSAAAVVADSPVSTDAKSPALVLKPKAAAAPKPPKPKPAPKPPVKRKPVESPFLEPLKRIRLDIPDDAPPVDAPLPTHPAQILDEAEYDSFHDYLASWLVIEHVTGVDERPRDYTNKITTEATLFDRIITYRNEGRLTSLNPDRKSRDSEPLRWKEGDQRDHLVDHACHFSKLVHDERKKHIAIAKKVSKMVMGHFEELEGREERAKLVVEKQLKALAKATVREVRKKWKMAAGVSD